MREEKGEIKTPHWKEQSGPNKIKYSVFGPWSLHDPGQRPRPLCVYANLTLEVGHHNDRLLYTMHSDICGVSFCAMLLF